MALSKYLMTAFALASIMPWAKAESHTVVFTNKCALLSLPNIPEAKAHLHPNSDVAPER